jgi:hypothetical protein
MIVLQSRKSNIAMRLFADPKLIAASVIAALRQSAANHSRNPQLAVDLGCGFMGTSRNRIANHLTHRSPSPGGEGRGEGESKTKLVGTARCAVRSLISISENSCHSRQNSDCPAPPTFVSFVSFCLRSVSIFTTFHVVLAAPKLRGGGRPSVVQFLLSLWPVSQANKAYLRLLKPYKAKIKIVNFSLNSQPSTIFYFHTPFHAYSNLLTAINAYSSPPPPLGYFFVGHISSAIRNQLCSLKPCPELANSLFYVEQPQAISISFNRA